VADWRLALRFLSREWLSGELRLLVLALVIAIASLSSVGFFADRVKQALERESHQLLGADLLLVADHPWRAEIADEARRRGLQLAETRVFPSMVQASEQAQLADIKAVSASYPLRGKLRTAVALNTPDSEAAAAPAAGTVWPDERLATTLGLVPGQRMAVGETQLTVVAVLTLEPDRGVNFFGVAPRLMMNLADLPATGLVQVGSRVTYRLLVAGPDEALGAFRAWVEPRLGRGERLEDTQNARPEIRSALDRAQRFLGLAALLSVVLAAVALGLAARRYVQRHLDAYAVMRCLGATQQRLLGISVRQFLLLGVVGALTGAFLGFVAHWALEVFLGDLLATRLPPPGWQPAVQGVAVGLLLLVGFVLPPLLQLKRVPTLRVLRRELGPPEGSAASAYGLGAAALVGLMFWIAGEPKLGGWVAGGFGLAVLVFGAITWACLRLLARLATRLPAGRLVWARQGLRALTRRPLAVSVQVVALALGFMALILLTVTRGELLTAWRSAVPAEAPNRFVINIQPEQVAPVADFLRGEGLAADLHPMIRGRLVAINERNVSPADYTEDRAKRLVDREFNLSWTDVLPAGNTTTRGRWFALGDRGHGVASVEEGLAKTLGIQVGDRLTYTIAGETVKMQVVGLRKLNWDSMRVNFFVVTPSGVLEPQPKSYITSFYLPADKQSATSRLVAAFPNLTVVDVSAILKQVQSVTEQVIAAVQFLFVFSLAAGLVVLYAALTAVFDERRYEMSVMRALGARRRQLLAALTAEFAAVGALAGLVAALGAMAVGQVLARQVFDLASVPAWWLLPAATAGGAALVALAGSWASFRLLQAPPLESLRAAD